MAAMRIETKLVSVAAAVLAFAVAGCSGLLDVTLPGNVTSDALNDPALATTLVLSAQGDFECGFVDYMRFPGQWFELFQNSSQSRPDALSGLRSSLLSVYADPCASGTGPIWTPIQVPRQDAERAIDIINGYDATAIPGKDYLIAKARLFEGYSIQLLGEMFCGVTLDGGPELSRQQAYAEAENRFTEAINLASGVTGSRAVAADSVLNAAYVGRARARMYQGAPAADVIADASQVDQGFVFYATYDASPTRRHNRIYQYNNANDVMMPHRDYTDLTIEADGTLSVGGAAPDPRVPVEILAKPDPRGFTNDRVQHKYNSYGSPIPFSTWREAQLMIAEVDPSQSLAVINNLRAVPDGISKELDASAWPLPAVTASLTPAEITSLVMEERRRELWMQGTEPGDKLRWGYPAWDDTDEYGQQLGPGGCIPIPYLEQGSNPNL